MKPAENILARLKQFVKDNEVVYQVYNELIEVSNEENKENRKTLLGYFDKTTNVELYEKGVSFVHEPFEDLDNWATPDDVLFLLEIIGVLICIPKSNAVKVGLIEE